MNTEKFVMPTWHDLRAMGFNFVGEFGRIVEEYWEDDWPMSKRTSWMPSWAQMVRLHLQVDTNMAP